MSTTERCAKCGTQLTVEATASIYTTKAITLAWCRSCTHDNRQQTLELADRVCAAASRVFQGSFWRIGAERLHAEKVGDSSVTNCDT